MRKKKIDEDSTPLGISIRMESHEFRVRHCGHFYESWKFELDLRSILKQFYNLGRYDEKKNRKTKKKQ